MELERNEQAIIVIDTKEIPSIVREYLETCTVLCLKNLREMHEFLDLEKPSKLNLKEINKLNRSIINRETKMTIKSPPTKNVQGQIYSQQNSSRLSKKLYSHPFLNYFKSGNKRNVL